MALLPLMLQFFNIHYYFQGYFPCLNNQVIFATMFNKLFRSNRNFRNPQKLFQHNIKPWLINYANVCCQLQATKVHDTIQNTDTLCGTTYNSLRFTQGPPLLVASFKHEVNHCYYADLFSNSSFTNFVKCFLLF